MAIESGLRGFLSLSLFGAEWLGAVLRSLEEKVAFAGVTGEGGGAFEFGAGFVEPVECGEEVAAYAGSQVVDLQGWFVG